MWRLPKAGDGKPLQRAALRGDWCIAFTIF
jgi:hypothetical protein